MIIVQIAGRLGRDAETRFTPSGQKVTSLNIATNIRKGGKEETVWWRVTIWGDRFYKLMPYLKKGAALIVVGEMNKPEIWIDKEGRSQVSLEMTAEIVRFSPFGNPDRPPEQQAAGGVKTSSPNSAPGQSSNGFNNDFADFNSPSTSYGSFSSGKQSGAVGSASSYSQTLPDEEPLPF